MKRIVAIIRPEKFEDVKKDDEVELYNSKYKEEQEEVL